MRVYVPLTLPLLRAALDTGALGPAPLTAFAVTEALRAEYRADGDDELEHLALTDAARASLRLLDADAGAPRRRVVAAADVPDGVVQDRSDLDRAAVRVGEPVPVTAVDAWHVDEPGADPVVRAAVDAVLAADLDDPDATFAVDAADAVELGWYARQEGADLV